MKEEKKENRKEKENIEGRKINTGRKRGNKRNELKGKLDTENSIKKYFERKEAKKIETPKRKYEEGNEEGNMVFGEEGTPRKKIKFTEKEELIKVSKVIEKGRVLRMKDKFEVGNERRKKGILDSKKKEIFILRNGERKSPGVKECKKELRKESLPVKASKTPKINAFTLLNENGAENYKKMGQKSDFSATLKTKVHETSNRWSGGCVTSVWTNGQRETDEYTEEPIKFKQTSQLGLGHSEDNMLNIQ